jgi:hypothetical protein
MKRFAIVATTLLLSLPSLAWEKERNPDRFPSLGVTLDSASGEGDATVSGLSQDVEETVSGLTLDVRLPLSNSFTLSTGLGGYSSEVEAIENNIFLGSKSETSGGRFFISGRYYFNN